MKAGMLNGQARTSAGKIRRMPNGERSISTGIVASEWIPRVFHLAQEMGGPLNVVIGRMDYLLERGTEDRETIRSLKAIVSQAQQLVALRQQLLDEARASLNVTELGSAVSVEAERADA